jgi:hypothetical protein
VSPRDTRLAASGVGIRIIGFYPCRFGTETGGPEPVLQDHRQLSTQRADDVCLASVLDPIEARPALFATQRVELPDGRRLAMSSRNTVT